MRSVPKLSLPLVVLAGIAVTSIPVVSGQALLVRPLPSEPLEKYDNPPAPRRLLQFSPRRVSQSGSHMSYQVNVDANGNNIVGDAANEPSICVDPTNGNKMAIGWRQFDDVSSNFRQAGYAYTNNGGISWTFPGILENNVFRSDPVLNADSTGRFFYLSLLQSFFDDLWRSLNGGQSWTDIAPATGGDKQWFTIDNTTSSGHGFQYQAWSPDGNNYQGRQFSRSTNGGFTWQDPINIPNSPRWGTLDVDSNGTLFISGVNLNTNQIWCVRSSNAKNGAVTPSFDQSATVNLGGRIGFSQSINPVGLVGQIYLAADRSGTSTNNNIYVLASVQPNGFTTGSDVMFVRSTNGGQTFSAPRRINDDPVNHTKWHWFGALSVAPTGRIDVIWLDTRNASNDTDSELFYSYSIDAGDTWSANRAVSNSFDPSVGYPNQDKMGDYITLVSDTTGANVAYCATFNQEQDIYYVRLVIPPAAPVATSASAVSGSTFTAGWSSVSGATGYRLDVSTNSSFSNYVSGYQDLDVGNVTSVSVAGLSPNTTYYYRVRAYNSGGTSANSNTITVLTGPASPAATAASNVTTTSFIANWNSVSGATSYRLDVSTSSTFSSFVSGYQDLDVGNVTSQNVTGLSAGGTYYYRVRARNSGSASSDNSNVISVVTAPTAPTATAASGISSSWFSANWNSSTGASGYRLDVATDSSFTGYVNGYQDRDVGSVTSFGVKGLSANTNYYYRVRAYNSNGLTGNSNVITVLTTIPPNPTPNPSATPKPSAPPGVTPTPRPSSTPK